MIKDLWLVHLPAEVAASGIPPVYWCTAHYVEMLLKAEVPLVHSAFRMSGFTPSQWCIRAGQMKAEQSREENSTSQQRVLSTSPAMMRNIVAASQSWPWWLFLMEAES
ncbi:hypothetical protein CRUP_018686 [Coryphaenoides rupestris]|nr:hypothetical protein CRUP_018686 [Coryphaenoides rupestris]